VDVNPGVYNVTITKKGFATTRAGNQEVQVGASLTLNLSLQVGAPAWYWRCKPRALSCRP